VLWLQQDEDYCPTAGGRYRFRFIDGHWHAGLVVALQHLGGLQEQETGSGGASAGGAHRQEAVVRFLHPTQRSMLGGVQLPASALQVSTAVRGERVVAAALLRVHATPGAVLPQQVRQLLQPGCSVCVK
jgi:hypothetical protein